MADSTVHHGQWPPASQDNANKRAETQENNQMHQKGPLQRSFRLARPTKTLQEVSRTFHRNSVTRALHKSRRSKHRLTSPKPMGKQATTAADLQEEQET